MNKAITNRIGFLVMQFYLMINTGLICQSDCLHVFEDILVGPENVDRIYPVQKDFYLKKYTEIKNIFEQIIIDCESTSPGTERNWWTIQMRSSLTEMTEGSTINYKKRGSELNIILLDDYIDLWDNLDTIIQNRNKVIKLLQQDACYVLHSMTRDYWPSEYFLKTMARSRKQEWLEITNGLDTLDEFSKKSKHGYWGYGFPEKECISVNAFDCQKWGFFELFWNKDGIAFSDERCTADFKWNAAFEECHRKVEIELKRKSDPHYIIVDKDEKEIAIIDWSRINCK